MTSTSLHIRPDTPAAEPYVHTYATRSPLAGVSLDGGSIRVICTSVADLRAVAAAFNDAADQLAAELLLADLAKQP